MSEIDVLDVLNAMLETERAFLQSLRFLSNDRESLLAVQQRNVATTLALLRMYMASNTGTATFTIPITVPTGWNDPVVVRPTADQISAATTPIEISDCACAICQEEIDGSAMRIRHCQHTFHNTCIAEWFTRSVHCPNCRHDIRSVDHPAPTSADPIRTPLRVSNPLAEWMPAGYPTHHTEDTEESDEHHA